MDLRAPNMTRAERFGNRSMSLYSAERMYLRTVFELAIRTLSLTALKESKPKAVCYVLSNTFNEFSIFSADCDDRFSPQNWRTESSRTAQ